MPVPKPTKIFRIVHKDNLPVLIQRGGIHSPNHCPNDGLNYKTIHNAAVQASRQVFQVPCGAGGTIHDYVPFYFGPLSVMLLNLKTGRVAGYDEGQRPIIYLVTSVQLIEAGGDPFVFSDGHGLAAFTQWFDDSGDLAKVDWNLVGERYWSDNPQDNDRKRRKQAEFLAHQFVPWDMIRVIGVYDEATKAEVEAMLDAQSPAHRPTVRVKRDWYYH